MADDDLSLGGWIATAVFIGIVVLLWIGGKKVYDDWRGPGDAGSPNCQLYAERLCFKYPIKDATYQQCVARTLQWAEPEAWCREALREFSPK